MCAGESMGEGVWVCVQERACVCVCVCVGWGVGNRLPPVSFLNHPSFLVFD